MKSSPQTDNAGDAAPSVTIVIAAYNASATIARAVRSALAEPEVAEVVVVDDASADDTVSRTRAADDGSGRLKIFIQPKNGGPSAARNRALRESAAPWIGILDADDFFLPGRIKGLLKFIGEADFIADDLWQIDEDNIDGPRKTLLGKPLAGSRMVGFTEFVSSNVSSRKRQRGELGFIKPLMRRSFLSVHGLQYQEHMRLGEDYELYARALAAGARLCLVPAQGYVSVMRPSSLSGRHTETDLYNLRECDHAIGQNPHLTPEGKAALRRHYLSIDCRLQWRLLITAVKNRDAHAAFASFIRPYPVPFYLLSQLAEQFVLRTSKKLKRRDR